jgi:heptaprenyl diphosphate synthase/octaprenyl-diphosphate synthase
MGFSPAQLDLSFRRHAEHGASAWLQPVNLGDVLRQAEIADDLVAVERRLLERTASRSALLAASGAHIVSAGGKRLRAALVLLSARLGSYDAARASRPAVAMELLHAASLVHDDLVDNAGQRRGRVTVHERWDNDVALMLGDYFFALAAHELAGEPDPRIIRFYASAAQTLVEGELSPVTLLEPMDTALAQYFTKIGSKTAVLFETACKAGIAVAGGDEAQIAALASYGYDLGLAFQIVDDVLDFTGDEALLGKPAGNDLREGTLTLPLIYAVAHSHHSLLREVARTARPDPACVPQLVAAVLAAGGPERAMATARELATRAFEHLASFPPSPARRALVEIGAFVLTRQQ